MTETEEFLAGLQKSMTPERAAGIILLVSVLGPVLFLFHPLVEGYLPHVTLTNLFFSFDYVHDHALLQIHGIVQLSSILAFSSLRLLFAWQVFKLYNGEVPRRRTLWLGLVAEGPIIVLSIFFDLTFLISFIIGGWLTSFLIPLPIPLIALLLLLRFRPPRVFKTAWEGTPDKEHWWDQTESPPEQT